MKRQRVLQISYYMLIFLISLLFSFMPACKFLGQESTEKPTKTDTEDVEDPVETDAEDTDTEDVEDPVETDAEDTDTEDVEDPVETDAEDTDTEDVEDPVETDTEKEKPETPSKELRYAEGALIFFQSGRYRYLARVTKDTDTEAKEVPVHIFVEQVREKIGDSLPVDEVRSTRKVPPDGWGTRRVALEYLENSEWTFSWDVREMENHYVLPGSDEDAHRVELTNVRFRVPVQR